MRLRHWRTGSFLLGMFFATPAMAEETQPTAQSKAAARALAEEGRSFYDAGRYEAALKSFREAEAKVHAPTILLMMARAHDRLGQLVEARAIYKRIVEEKLAANAAAAFVQAQASAKDELASLTPRIPTLKVVVRGATGSAVALTLDGVSLAPSSFVERNPGDHVLIAALVGRRSVARTIHLTEGEREELALDAASLPVEPASMGPAHASGQGPSSRADGTQDAFARPPAQRDDARGPNKALVYTGIALTGVAAGLGAVFGIVSLNNESAADDLYSRLEAKNGVYFCAGGKNPADCETLLNNREDAWFYTKAAWGSFGGAAVLGAATLIYYWTASPLAESKAYVQMIPHVAAGGGGVVVTGMW